MPRILSTSIDGIIPPRIWPHLQPLEWSLGPPRGARSRSTGSSLSKELAFMSQSGPQIGVWVLTAIFTASIGISQMTETPVSEESLILGDANRGAGEPMIAVNRRDPNNTVIVAMAT